MEIVTTTPTEEPLAERQRATRRRVARFLLESGPSTAAELAQRLAVTPAAVRRHLDALVDDGLVAAQDRRQRGPRGRGRPARAFALTDAGRDAFDTAYDELAVSALHYLADHAGPEAVDGFARERVARLGDRVRERLAAAPAEGRVTVLAEALSAAGYAASTTATAAGGEQLCQHHCPVAHVAGEFPQLCEAETALFSELLGTHVQRLATIAHGDGVCTTHVPGAGRATSLRTESVPTTRRTSS